MHEREIAEYKMKLHSFESEVDKLTTRLHRALAEKDRLETRLESGGEFGKPARRGLDRDRDMDFARQDNWDRESTALTQKIQRLELENDRLRAELDRLHTDNKVSRKIKLHPLRVIEVFPPHSQNTISFGRAPSVQDLDRVQERADKTVSELRRTQAELRVTQVSSSYAKIRIRAKLFCYRKLSSRSLLSLLTILWK